MDVVQLRIFILYSIINKKNRTLKVCSKNNFQIAISGFVATLMRIAHIIRIFRASSTTTLRVLATFGVQ